MHFDWVLCDERASDGEGVYEQLRPRTHRFVFLSDGLAGLHADFPEGSLNSMLRKPVVAEELDRLLASWETAAGEAHEEKEAQHAEL
jgi:hypothetical protein